MLYLLRLFAIIFLVIFLIGFISRIALQYMFRRMGKKYGWQQQSNPRPEGDITVNQTQHKEKMMNKDVGDYVDYEEVKE